jgi:hypothetical protein
MRYNKKDTVKIGLNDINKKINEKRQLEKIK